MNTKSCSLPLYAILAAGLLLGACGETEQDVREEKPAYRDTNLALDARVDDLVSRMTLSEKISQLYNEAPAIERLGVARYNWWNEALHGVARAGKATVFPQAIGMAATFDKPLMHRTATTISDEARAKHHYFKDNEVVFRYTGLTFWSPNINIFRDPRWGRGQETYGEDPYLTGTLAVEFIQGMQGNHPRYLKTSAMAKHYAVHSGPEKSRHSDDYHATPKDLWETYLPAFDMAVNDADVESIMCAYNRVNGQPACGSELLLKDILRDQWQFDGHVVSDCGALADFYDPNAHDLVRAPAQAAA
jgi:beta-glucosidase